MGRKSSRSKLCKCCLVLSYIHATMMSSNKEKGDNAMISFMNHYKNNQVNAWLSRKLRAKKDESCCWFDQKPSNAQLNKLEQHPLFTERSEQTSIEVTFVSSWMKVVFLMAKRLLLPIIRCRDYLLH